MLFCCIYLPLRLLCALHWTYSIYAVNVIWLHVCCTNVENHHKKLQIHHHIIPRQRGIILLKQTFLQYLWISMSSIALFVDSFLQNCCIYFPNQNVTPSHFLNSKVLSRVLGRANSYFQLNNNPPSATLKRSSNVDGHIYQLLACKQ